MPFLVPPTYPSFQILAKPDGGVSNFQSSGKSFINKNCHDFRTNHEIDVKLGPVTKLDKRNTTTLKKMTMTSCRQCHCLIQNLW